MAAFTIFLWEWRSAISIALSVDVLLQRLQGRLISLDAGSDTENVSSSNCREFDGGIIAHAGGAGGLGCG